MEGPNLTSWLKIENEAAIDLLSRPERVALLAPFFESEKSVSEAAEAAGVGFHQMYYLCRRATALGLLKVATLEKRKGRSLKRYRSAAETFFVPYAHMKETLREIFITSELRLLPKLTDATMHSFKSILGNVLQDDEWGRLYWYSETKGLSYFTNSNEKRFPTPKAYLDYLRSAPTPYLRDATDLYLSQADARALQQELVDIYERYAAQQSDGSKYHLRLYLAQFPEDCSA